MSPIQTPSELTVLHTRIYVTERNADILHQILRQSVVRKPVHVITFFRFHIARLPFPVPRFKEQIYALMITAKAVHGVDKLQLIDSKLNTYLLADLPHQCFAHGLITINMPCGQCILTVFKTGPEPTDQ